MISTLPSYDDELLNSAYANISLIADKAWTFDKDDIFHKLNQSLWIQNCKVTEKYKENGNYRPKRVRDVIPYSYLAKYGNYEYNEERERMYKSGENGKSTVPLGNFCWTEITEPWMLPEVEEHFTRLISNDAQSNRESSTMKRHESESAIRNSECNLKSHWHDSLQNRNTLQNLSSNNKREIGTNYDGDLINFANENGPDSSSKSDEIDDWYQRNHRRYTIENSGEMLLHMRVSRDAVRNFWNPAKIQQQLQYGMHLQCYQQRQRYTNRSEQNYPRRDRQQQFYCAFQYQPLIVRTEYQAARTEMYNVTRKSPAHSMSPEVSEFLPKIPVHRYNVNKEHGNRVQYLSSVNDMAYQNELFPYKPNEAVGNIYQNVGVPMIQAVDANTFLRPPQQWYQRVPPTTQIQISTPTSTPMCPVQPLRAVNVTHPLQVHDKFLPAIQPALTPIPVYQRPLELYHENTQQRKSQGVDFKNLILLTKSAMKVHRGQSKNVQRKPSYVLETRNHNSKPERNVLQRHDKMSTSKCASSEQEHFVGKCEPGISSHWKNVDDSAKNLILDGGVSDKSPIVISSEVDESDTCTRKRLYRDVLANVDSTSDSMSENVFEKRYDELEQQAMEQYRNSEESLALKYQELERQAMEQYKYSSGAQEEMAESSAHLSAEETNESRKIMKRGDCQDGRKCSGFGGCSPVNKEKEAKKGSPKRTQITLLKPEAKERNVSRTTNKNTRSTIMSKSLTTLTPKVPCKSKNTSKGASGDKTDRRLSVRASTKRRLILMSPFERKSEARLMRATDLEEFYCISRAKKNIFTYYNNSEIRKTGGGDENITIIKSPRAEVWLSGFWTT